MTILCNQFIRKRDLTEQDFAQMYQLMESYYENITPKEFLRTLAMKDYIFLVKDELEGIQAFTTLQRVHISGGMYQIQGILLGDPITHRDYEQKENLFSQALAEYKKVHKGKQKEYVFFNCKEFGTYLAFHELFHHSYPCVNEDTPLVMKRVMNLYGEMYYSQEYDAVTGLIKYTSRPVIVKEPLVSAEEEVQVPEVEKYFIHRNPGWKKGYELVCAAELTDSNQIHNVLDEN